MEAKLLPTGEVVMENLPFFSEVRATDECVKGPNGRTVRDRKYLEEALRRHQVRTQQLGYKPPMNLRHIFDNPERVGTYELTHIGEEVVNPEDQGAPRATVYVRKIWKNLDSFRKSDGYDYRSPEISPDEPDEFAALALLKDKAPFNKYQNVDPGKVPVVEVEVSVPEAFEARGYQAPQVWRREKPIETFAGAVNAGALSFDTTRNKEGDMPAATEAKPEKKEPSMDERMEAMVAKCFGAFESKMKGMFEDMLGKKDKAKDDGSETMEDKPKSEEKKPEEKKPEAAEARPAPDQALPPAVSQARPGETFATKPPAGHRYITDAEYDRMLKNDAWITKLQKERELESFAAKAEDAIRSKGFEIDGKLRARIREKAAAGKAVLETFVEVYSERPVAASGDFLGMGGGGFDPDASSDPGLKKAMDLYGSRPDAALRIKSLYQSFLEGGGRGAPPEAFPRICQGVPEINPAILKPRGGM